MDLQEKRRLYNRDVPAHGSWYVVICNYGYAQRSAGYLEAKGFRVYLPMLLRGSKGRKAHSWTVREMPLLSRYLFVTAEQDTVPWARLGETPGVESVLRNEGQYARVPHRVVLEIMSRELAGAFDTGSSGIKDLADVGLTKGQFVRITKGEFISLQGAIEGLVSPIVARVLIQIFGRSFYANVPLALIEK